MKRTGLPRKDRPLSGPQHYWDTMRRLTKEASGFTISDVHGASNGARWRTVQTYTLACARAGHIEAVGTRPVPEKNRDAVVYRVKVTAPEAPFERGYDFADTAGHARVQLWTAMRSLPSFTPRELAIAASTDDVQVSFASAKEYITALKRAGYLLEIQPALSRRPATLRLKPGMNTGPKPPAVSADGTVIDRNRRTVVGSAKPAANAEVRS
ncbi:hypothetical protein [Methylorubrum zatmanii]